jgi:hypothetical protein
MLSMRANPLLLGRRLLVLLTSVTLILTGMLIVTADNAQAAPVSSRATDDAYVVASAPTVNNGNSTILIEGTSGTKRVVYLKFIANSVPTNAPVQVELFSEKTTRIATRLYAVANTTWSENTVNWNNRPQLGAQASSVEGAIRDDWVTFDVTSVVRKPGTYSFAIDSPTGGTSNNNFSSTENSNGNGPRLVVGAIPPKPAAVKPFFVIYYLWWSTNHWHAKLGPDYPYTKTPNPLPATLDASGCNAKTLYRGNQVTDVSQKLAYQQDDPQVILNDVRLAASSGVTGFAINWRGVGTTTQTPTSNTYNKRLQAVFDAVHTINAEGIPFKLMLNYKGSVNLVPLNEVRNDFNYFMARYGKDPALDHTYSAKPEVIYAGTWKYTNTQLAAMSDVIRPNMYFLGDEKPTTWSTARAQSLDGDAYYWSSQNPYKNPQGVEDLRELSRRIHLEHNPDGSTKVWLAPIIPGYNAQLLTGSATCTARNNGETMPRIYKENITTNPDGWDVISWNEITEGTYLVPLTRYGTFYTNKLKSVIANGG